MSAESTGRESLFASQADAAIAATLMKNRGMTAEQAVAETKRLTGKCRCGFSLSECIRCEQPPVEVAR